MSTRPPTKPPTIPPAPRTLSGQHQIVLDFRKQLDDYASKTVPAFEALDERLEKLRTSMATLHPPPLAKEDQEIVTPRVEMHEPKTDEDIAAIIEKHEKKEEPDADE